MYTITVREFRNRLATSLNQVDAGEQIVIRRNKKFYTIIPIAADEFAISPTLQAKIDKAREEVLQGQTTRVGTHEELDKYLESL